MKKTFTTRTKLIALMLSCTALAGMPHAFAQYAQQTMQQMPQAQDDTDTSAQKPARPAGDKTQYSSVMPDIPLMDGMKEQAPPKDTAQTAKTAADQPQETTADVPGNDKQVISYYHQALTQAGWKTTDPTLHTYTKDGQTMTLNTNFVNGHTTVRFQLAPRAQSGALAPAQSNGVKYNTPLKGAITAQPMRN